MPLPNRRSLQASTTLVDAAGAHLQAAAEETDDDALAAALEEAAGRAGELVADAEGAPKLCVRRGTLRWLAGLLRDAVREGIANPGTKATIERLEETVADDKDCP